MTQGSGARSFDRSDPRFARVQRLFRDERPNEAFQLLTDMRLDYAKALQPTASRPKRREAQPLRHKEILP